MRVGPGPGVVAVVLGWIHHWFQLVKKLLKNKVSGCICKYLIRYNHYVISYLHCHRRQVFREKIHNPVISNLKFVFHKIKFLYILIVLIHYSFLH